MGYVTEINWFWLDKSSKNSKNNTCEVSKDDMARYISSQGMHQQKDLSLWGEYNL